MYRRFALAYRVESMMLFIASISLEALVVSILVAVWASFFPCFTNNCYTPGCGAYEQSFYVFLIAFGTLFLAVSVLRYFGFLRGVFRREKPTEESDAAAAEWKRLNENADNLPNIPLST